MYLHGDALANLRGGAGWIHCAFVFGFVEGVMDAGTKRAILYLLVGCLLSFSIAQDPCFVEVCFNNGTCYIENGSQMCICPPSYTGMLCESKVLSDCQSMPCENGGTCSVENGVVRCTCIPIFTGQFCESVLNGCDSNPCLNGATCSNFFGGFTCACPPGYTERQCQTDIDDCAANPCLNGGTCMDEVDGYTCECPPGFTGSNCSISIDDCSEVECLNDGDCIDLVGDYYCDCMEGFAGRNCELISDCPLDNLTLCQNNGFCNPNTSSCSCITGFTGTYCETEINECDSNPCDNGTCVDRIGSFSCNCFSGYTGQQCEQVLDMCQSQPCYNGAMCVSSINGFDCFCRQGYTGQFCQVDINECLSSPCQNGGNCTEMVNDFSCDCLPGYSGAQCEIDSCSSEPCENGGTCIANGLTYSCVCSLDYTDENCTTLITPCYFDPCLNGATCINDDFDNYTCGCLPGFTDDDCSVNIDDCESNPCQNAGTCNDLVDGYQCDCSTGYTGSDCQTNIDDCLITPCFNNGTCTDLVNSVSCECPTGFNGSLCQNNINECSSSPCSSSSTCIDEIDGFTCLCPMGLTGPLCDISIIDCSGMPCGNNGTCTDIPGGYECSCSPGYTGIHCMENINDCLPDPCNNGTCIDGIDEYTCVCPQYYTGDNCETPIDHCDSNPCSSLATCVSTPGSYHCICPIDFTGTGCFAQINDCQPNPCNNGGTCSDLIGTFECSCPLGFEGSVCEHDINECASLPCLNGGNCTDLVNGYSCTCPDGFNGTNCENSTITACESIVCENGGMCDDTLTGFECLCPNGYTGTYCHINIDDCLSNPCLNNATCVDEIANYTCECTEGFDGRNCAIDTDLCSPQPCFNGGTCTETSDSFSCTCPPGYSGTHCQTPLNPCSSDPCLNGGICTNVNGTDFSCVCSQAYGGDRCEIKLFPDCLDMPCLNNGTCTELMGSGGSGVGEPGPKMYCQCPVGYTGEYCETITDLCLSFESSPCKNNATCTGDSTNFTCTCLPGFSGELCNTELIGCHVELYPCLNGGECVEMGGQFMCNCAPGFTGPLCGYGINECRNQPCLNGGTCRDFFNYYVCSCPPNFNGTNCEIVIPPCNNVSCINGLCIDDMDTSICQCNPGWTGFHCDTEINECDGVDCINGTCVDLINDFTCQCSNGFTGQYCETNIDDCASINCNNGTCIDGIGSYQCNCSLGYMGSNCDTMIDDCAGMPCMNNASCVDLLNNYTCVCSDGFTGRFCEINIDDCFNINCNNGSCEDLVNDYMCNCSPGFTSQHCETNINECDGDPCNDGTCIDGINSFNCTCPPSHTGNMCETEIDLCLMEQPCLNNGTCTSTLIGGVPSYHCTCILPYSGSNCDVIDFCLVSPCQNNATCIANLTHGDYTCQCVPGWTGRHCESEINECDSVDCINGTCVDLINDFTCQCSDGFTGQYCEIDIDDCASINCNNGTCIDGIGSYQCNCSLGYMGSNCDTMIDDCAGMPCMNNASCVDLLNNYTCFCSDGFTGRFCEINIDDCFNINCNNGSCEDLVNDYMCNCSPGFTSQHCETNINECDGDPCNDGTCIDGINSFNCTCPPSHTGNMCETEIDLCSMEQPCLNNGTCTPDLIEGIMPTYYCSCSMPLYNGSNCELIDSCSLSPCQNNATCIGNLTNGDYVCNCSENYFGSHCQRFDYCHSSPCQNDGTCINGSPGNLISDTFLCICMPQFTGSDCSIELSPCFINPCMNGGTCMEDGGTHYCQCPVGYTEHNCSEVFSSDTPYFNGDSYTLVPYSPSNSNSSLINLHFRTSSQSGLLLYVSEEDHSSYLSLGIEAGLLSLRMRQEGTFIQSIARYHPVSDDRWHSVEVTQNGLEIKIEVDGYPNSTSLIDMFLMFEPAVTYVGGFNNFTALPSAVLQSSGFIGYINATIQLGGESLHIIDDSIAGKDIGHGEAAGSCGPATCSNGGICIEESGSSFSCHCPIGFRGDTCEQDIDINIPYFNTRSYHILSNDAFSLYGGIEIDITLHTSSSNGLICYLYDSTNVTNDYLTFYLQEGGISIEYSMGGSVRVVSYQGNVSDNEWHLITVQFNTSGLYLILDESLVLYSNNATLSSIYLTSPLFIGGLPNGLIAHSPSVSGLNGCIRDVQINNMSLDLIQDGIYGLGLLECPQSICPLVQCLNGGSCVDSDVSILGFECSCPNDYNGTYCEVSLSLCTPNPCLFDGVCTEFDNRTYSCQCTLGRQGRLCDEELNITVPAFYGNSYLAYRSLSSVVNVQNDLMLTLTLKPTSPNGLILFNGHTNTDFSQYVSISLVNSCIVYKFNLGSGFAMISSPITLGLNQWHTITANRTGRVGFLQVNNEEFLNSTSPGTLSGLNIAGDMWLGGTDQFNISQYAGVSTGLTGCISSVSVNGIPIDLVASAERGRNIGECNMTSCSSFPCLNGGTCVETGSSFICQCPFGYTGALCGVQTLSCSSSPCGNGGTCIEGVTEGDYACLCPLGFGGNNCNEMLQVSTPSFNQTSYQEYSLPSPISFTTYISLSFHPTSLNGLILYIGDVSMSRDFLSLSLVSGRVELRYDLGSGPAIIMSSSVIPLNQWTSVTVDKVRRDGMLVVNGSSTNGSSPGTTTMLNAVGGLYIGGGAGGVGGYQVSPNAGTEVGLTGCVNTATLRINSFSLGSVVSSRGVTQCQVDSCSYSPCQNGGSCVSTDLSYSCICPLGYTGDQCQQNTSIEEPSFSGASHISYTPSPFYPTPSIIQFYLELYPNASNGLILYNAGASGDYVSLYLQNGRVVLQFKQSSSNPVTITSLTSTTLGQWHSISASIDGENGSLVVDNTLPVTGNGDFTNSLILDQALYIGGHPNVSTLGLAVSVGLMGCIRDLDVVSDQIESFGIISNATDGAGISQCAASAACNVNPCLNGGKCIGVLVNGTIEERCQCSLPFAAGAKCEQRVSFSSAFFNGDGYLQFPIGDIPINSITIHTEIRLSIIPSNGSGLLLYVGYANPSSGNYLLVGMNEGKLEFRFQLGSGVGLVETSQPLAIGQQHDITLLRTDYKGRVLMSQGNSTVFTDGQSQGSSRHLNLSPYDFIMFVGGAPSVSLMSQQVYQTGFSGCILSAVQFGYAMNAEPVSFDTSLVGENVTPCS